jgi:electron transport complex protein RnfG
MEKNKPPENPSGTTRPFMKPVASLMLFAALGTGLVAFVAEVSQDRIAENQAQQAIKTLLPLLPEGGYDNEPHRDTIEVRAPALLGSDEPQTIYRVRLRGAPVAAILTVTAPDGYIGPVHLLVAVDTDGRLMGVRALQHQETPGLGDKIETGKNDWILGFTRRDLENPTRSAWAVRPDGGAFDQITGATVTSRTVVSAVRDALVYFAENRDAIFATPPPVGPDTQ